MKLCVIGTGRCGTTLLWRMLDSHPDLFVHRETHWIPALHEVYGTAAGPTEDMLDIVARTCHVTGQPTTQLEPKAFRASAQFRREMTVAAFGDAVGMFLAHAAGKRFWADKTPDYGYFTATLQLHWPECRVLNLIRDGVPCAQSMSRHIGYRALVAMGRTHWPPLAQGFTPRKDGYDRGPLAAYADLWAARLQRSRDEAQRLSPGSYMELRYEDLVRSPRDALARVAQFAELSDPTDWLDSAAAMVDPARAAPRPRNPQVVAAFGPRPAALLEELGYDPISG